MIWVNRERMRGDGGKRRGVLSVVNSAKTDGWAVCGARKCPVVALDCYFS